MCVCVYVFIDVCSCVCVCVHRCVFVGMCVYECVMSSYVYEVKFGILFIEHVSRWEGTMEKVGKIVLSNITF